MSEFIGNSPRTFISFHCLEKKTTVQEKHSTGEDQELVISPLGSSAGTVQTPEIYTSPVKTLTVLKSTRPGTNKNETISQSVERGPH